MQPCVEGVRCLDLFCGSGALGLEAVSRGAASVTLVDRNPVVVSCLREQCGLLDAQGVEIIAHDVLRWLRGAGEPYGIVFLDPPYGGDRVAACCALLESNGWLADGAWIYLEAEASAGVPSVPSSWEILRSKRAGEVGYHLAQRNNNGEGLAASGPLAG